MSQGVRHALFGLGTLGSSFLDAFLRARQQAMEQEERGEDRKLRREILGVELEGKKEAEMRLQHAASERELALRGQGGITKQGRVVVNPARERPMSRAGIAAEQEQGPMTGERAAWHDLLARNIRGAHGRAPANISEPMGRILAAERERAFEPGRKVTERAIAELPDEETRAVASQRLAGKPVEFQQLALEAGLAPGGGLQEMMSRSRELARREKTRTAASTTSARERVKQGAKRETRFAEELGAREAEGKLIRPLAPGAPEPILPAQPRVGAKLSEEEVRKRSQQSRDEKLVDDTRKKALKGALRSHEIAAAGASLERLLSKVPTQTELAQALSIPLEKVKLVLPGLPEK